MLGQFFECNSTTNAIIRYILLIFSVQFNTQDISLTQIHPVRFIPTCAGNTTTAQSEVYIHSVHPHRCGEHTDSNLLVYQIKLNLYISTDFFQVVKEHFLRPEEGRRRVELRPFPLGFFDFLPVSGSRILIPYLFARP